MLLLSLIVAVFGLMCGFCFSTPDMHGATWKFLSDQAAWRGLVTFWFLLIFLVLLGAYTWLNRER